MGRKSRLKQAARLKRHIIVPDLADNNWLYCHGNPFCPNAKIIQHGNLDTCIDKAYQEIPNLEIEPRALIRKHCGEYAVLEGDGWHIIYKPLFDK
jgi:hypothetical protein